MRFRLTWNPNLGGSMERNYSAKACVSLFAAACILLGIPSLAQEVQTNPQVRYDVKHDVSLPLHELARTAEPIRNTGGPMLEPKRNLSLTVGLPGEDTVVQEDVLAPVQTTKILGFNGMSGTQAGGYYPPDTNGAIGTAQYVSITNVAYEVYDKTNGKSLLGPVYINTIWKGFGGECEQYNGGDPIVLWDKVAQRWLV